MSTADAVVRVVDDDNGFRTAICRLLSAAGFRVRSYASAGDYLLGEEDDDAGCVLLDLRMPGPDGLSLQDAIARRANPLPVVFLTAHGDVETSVKAMKHGAEDFLTKPVKREALLSAIHSAVAKDSNRRAAREVLVDSRRRYEALSPREKAVLEQVVAGKLNKQIAAAIGASERTVKAHRAKIMLKMGVSSVAELVRSADRLSLDKPETVSN
jgi:FixJ family two-component response regulator